MRFNIRLKCAIHATVALAITASLVISITYLGMFTHDEIFEIPRRKIRELTELSSALSVRQRQFAGTDATLNATDLDVLRRDFLPDKTGAASAFVKVQSRVRALALSHGAVLTSSREVRPPTPQNAAGQSDQRVAISVSLQAKTAALLRFLVSLENAQPLLLVTHARLSSQQAGLPGSGAGIDRMSADLTIVAFVLSGATAQRDDAS
ncbi:MAG: type II secretion system protein GspM [Pseudomonadota bacterium]